MKEIMAAYAVLALVLIALYGLGVYAFTLSITPHRAVAQAEALPAAAPGAGQ